MAYVLNRVYCLSLQLKFYWNTAMHICIFNRAVSAVLQSFVSVMLYLHGPTLPSIEVCSLLDLDAWLVLETLISLGFS